MNCKKILDDFSDLQLKELWMKTEDQLSSKEKILQNYLVESDYLEYLYTADENSYTNLLQGIKGSLSKERAGSKPKKYSRILKNSKNANIQFCKNNSNSFKEILKNPDFFNKNLASSLEAYPDINFEFRVGGIEKVTKEVKGVRALLIFSLYTEIGWLEVHILELIDSYLKRKYANSQAFKEIFAIRHFLKSFSKDQVILLIEDIYHPNSIKSWKERGEHLFNQLFFTIKNSELVKQKVRRRGYARTSSVPRVKLKDPGRGQSYKEGDIYMNDIKARIKEKQLKLFEEMLDSYLEIKDPLLSREERLELLRKVYEVPDSEETTKILIKESEQEFELQNGLSSYQFKEKGE